MCSGGGSELWPINLEEQINIGIVGFNSQCAYEYYIRHSTNCGGPHISLF